MRKPTELLPIDAELTRQEIIALHKECLNPGLVALMNLINIDVSFVWADKCTVYDEHGQAYLDMLGAYGANNLGFNPEGPWQAIEYMHRKKVPNFMPTSLSKYAAILARNLWAKAPGELKHTFFCNSGAESVECAMKAARKATGKPGIISLAGAFHGKTFGALSVTGKEHYQKPFKPLVPECYQIPFGDLASLEEVLRTKRIAGFIVEPVLGEGGVRPHPDGYLKAAEKLCHQYGALFILDEIQTGFSRTGKFFAAEHDDLHPDIMCLAKSLGGSYIPIGATMMTPEVWNGFLGGINDCLAHTSTFQGGAYAVGAGIGALQEIDSRDLSTWADISGERLLREMREIAAGHPFIKEIRGKGLLIGIELNLPAGMVGKVAYEYSGSLFAGQLFHIWKIITAFTLNNPSVVRIEPPLIISKAQIDYFLTAFRAVLESNRGFGKLGWSTAIQKGKNALQSVGLGRKLVEIPD